MAKENELFIGDFPIGTSIRRGLTIAMFDYQRVTYAFFGGSTQTKMDTYVRL